MPPDSIPGFITKKEAEQLFNRSCRSLTRDFSAAVRGRDSDVLAHLKVRLEDGAEIEGTDITLDRIQELSNRGLTPTWFIESSWARLTYGEVSQPRRRKKPETTRQSNPAGTSTEQVESDDNSLAGSLQQQISQLQNDKERLYEELQIKNEQIREANERTRESNVLMKQLHELLGDVQRRALPPVPATVIHPAETTFDTSQRPASNSATARSESKTVRSPGKPRTTKRRASNKEPIKIPSTSNSRAAKEKKTTKGATEGRARSASKSVKPRWYDTPTLKRFFTR